ncbi:queuosine precursor transporter [Seleniivibrio woodruffii]|uniref:Probable queuosine precursor transporter n=1 Tax=Seleniivibrio woodruffii TaxID=1078050 RepID=A0A4R1K6A2_9BACT|nr:queuosine precursor transporter [Seleniivibrio woodruffii]TCK59500.1 hypothetical protein C8D98_2434 [Seleniivibrio woodruffii]TVZ35459.1 hypothetical protein OF66_1074 [Seleniivibrio woodruffii]
MNDRSLAILTAVFISSLTIASVLASKIITIAGVVVPAGILAYSVTFVISDTITEIWGRKTANNVVIGGFFSLVIVAVLIQISIALPSAPFWQNQDAYSSVLSTSARIIFASLVAYLISQYNDVWLFHLIKTKTGQKHLWLRNNLSTAMSQLLDSVIFILIAFYGTMPVVPLILGQWLIKLVIALVDTPIVYLMVHLLRHKRQPEASAQAETV